MTMARIKDAGYNLRTAYAAKGTATAGGAGDNAAVNGPWLDRLTAAGMIQSAKLCVAFDTTLASNQTLGFTMKLQDADDAAGLNAADVADSLNAMTTGAVVAQTATGQNTAEADFHLGKARRFIRAVITPDLSAGATDTASWFALWLLAGGDRAPSTRSAI